MIVGYLLFKLIFIRFRLFGRNDKLQVLRRLHINLNGITVLTEKING